MKYRRLGKTGLKVSVVGVGTWQFGGEWGQQFTQRQVDQILGRAKELGINLIDTAECYGDHLSESLIGQAIHGDRDDWVLATKFGHRFIGHLQREDLWSPEDVRTQLEDSLRALQVETIDLYQFHSGHDDTFDQDALWTMLDKQVVAGKIRHLGISVSSRIDPRHQATRATAVGASTIQAVYNRLDRRPEEDLFPICVEADLGVLARIPLASGFLSGKYRPGAEFAAADDLRSGWDPARIQERLQQVQEIQKSEVPPGVSMAPWALAWCLQHPAVTCVIPGCKSVEQVESNASAADLDLVRNDHPQARR
ncbi:MAG: aldo/keto reductase [Anaerolineae bacterium]|jgi:aryl-alcohol dehydrogenase-like predicted oxidoreductase